MRVGVCMTSVPTHIGGGYTIQWDIFKAFIKLLPKSRHEFILFCNPENADEVSKLLKDNSIDSVKTVIYKRTFYDRLISLCSYEIPVLRMIVKNKTHFEKLALKNKVEIMWFVGAGGYFLDTVPYIGIVYDLTHRLQPWFPEVNANGEWMRRDIFYSWFLRRAFKIITGTKVGKEEIEKFYQIPSERIKVLPHPTPSHCLEHQATELDNTILQKYKIPEAYLFYPAQFWSHKNHVNLLLSVKILKEKYGLTFPIVFVGSDKGNEKYVRNYSQKLGLSSQVYFLGFVPHSDMLGLYKNAFALTYISFCGPENLPPLEAFAIGCPVIASDIPGAREQLEDAALLVDSSDPEKIAGAIKNLKDNADLRDFLVQQGEKRAIKWTAKDFVRGVFEILDEFECYRICWDL